MHEVLLNKGQQRLQATLREMVRADMHKLASYQTIAFSLVELATHIEAARLLAYRAALVCERDKPDRRATSMPKWYAGDVLLRAVTTASRVLGGFGSRTDYPVERYLRDAFAWVPAQGTNEVQKLVIARELFA